MVRALANTNCLNYQVKSSTTHSHTGVSITWQSSQMRCKESSKNEDIISWGQIHPRRKITTLHVLLQWQPRTVDDPCRRWILGYALRLGVIEAIMKILASRWIVPRHQRINGRTAEECTWHAHLTHFGFPCECNWSEWSIQTDLEHYHEIIKVFSCHRFASPWPGESGMSQKLFHATLKFSKPLSYSLVQTHLWGME